KIHVAFVELGAEGPSFPTIVAAGTNAARPHHEPGNRVIRDGEPIVIDMGARYMGYCADLTRTVWVGEPNERLREVYPIVARAVEEVIERIHVGMTGKEMDAAARDYIASRGFGDAFSHGLGHGVGVRVHEAPSASRDSTDTLRAGNVITIEPGVYLPEWGGVRVEDVVLLTEDGVEVLTSASKMAIPDR
ncbi:MAG TPA: M24 family metallopeptidase, partial [Thermomicrobiales bacterium]|nr:M24 family metallopeptidase [Thermomicrobiales bacterium]